MKDTMTLRELQAAARAERRQEAADAIRRLRRNRDASRAQGYQGFANMAQRDAREALRRFLISEGRQSHRDDATLRTFEARYGKES